MKKLIIGLFIFVSITISSQVYASSAFEDALSRIQSLTREIQQLKLKLGAMAYIEGDVLPLPVLPPAVVSPITTTTDLTPRISYWSGKVNQHVSVSEGMWQTDPDGVSGAGIDKLTYCKKWYPNTTSVVDYKNETINAWHDAGNVNDYMNTRLSYKCVEPSIVIAPVMLPNLVGSVPQQSATSSGAYAGTPPAPLAGYVYNNGEAATSGTFSAHIEVSNASNGAGTISSLTPKSITRSLSPGGFGEAINSYHTFPSSGSYSMRTCADFTDHNSVTSNGGSIVESSETDNCSGWSNFTVLPSPTVVTVPVTPSVAVTSPNNGGESVEVGGKIEIRWDSNVAINTMVDVYVSDGTNKGAVVRGTNNGSLGMIYTLGSNLIPGSNYKACVSIASETPISDCSNNSFTIKSITPIPVATCIDSDEGDYPFTYGKATMTVYSSQTTPVMADTCYNSITNVHNNSCTGAGCQVMENICVDINGDGAKDTYNSHYDTCSNGCSNGACIKEVVTTVDIGCSGGVIFSSTTGQRCPAITPVVINPSITVLSPNGGESYKAGQQVVVKWKTKNIAYNANTLVSIMDDRTPDWQTRSYFGSSPALNYAKLVSSNGSEHVYEYTFTAPTTFNDTLPSKYQNIYGGNHYKMLVNVLVSGTAGTSSQKVLEDYSDSLFAINPSTIVVDIGCSNGAVYSSTTGQKCDTSVVTNLPPRIMYWSGKVNQHWDLTEKAWMTDPDGVSGAGIDKLTYCKKWYPNTTSVVEYGNETIGTWRDAGNVGPLYGSTKMSYTCVESTVVSTTPTLKVSLDSSTPSIQTITAGAGNVTFTKIKITAGSQDVNNLKAVQIASDLINATRLNNLAIYDGNTKIGSTGNGLSYGGSYYQSWVYLDNKLSIPANTSKVLSVVADTSPVGSASVISGDVRLGIAGWTFDSPGARVDPFGTAIYGNTVTIKSSSIDLGCSNGAIFSSTTGQRCPINTTPSITVLAPNGGEVYQAGQQITVKWKSDLVPSTSKVTMTMANVDSGVVLYLTDDKNIPAIFSTNDGVETFNIPITEYSGVKSGNYKISISALASNGTGVRDESDIFAISTSSVIDMGCQAGTIFSSTTGKKCSDKDEDRDTGCINGQNYSSTTGKPCALGLYKKENTEVVNNVDDTIPTAVPTTSPITRTLKRGVKGDDVKILQEFLGLYADGNFGRGTAAKVKEWQLKNGLYPDGSFGRVSRLKAGLEQ